MKGTRAMTNTLRFPLLSFSVIPLLGCLLLGPLLAALLGGGCVSPGPSDPDRPDSTFSSDADWRYERLSWEKLEAVEDWLSGPGPDRDPALAMEAELVLAEGRLHFARLEQSSALEAVITRRLSTAERGFQRVLDGALSDPSFRRRARAGLDQIRVLRADPGPVALPGVIPRSGWGARAPDPSNLTSNRTRWSRITVHHTALPTSTLGHRTSAETGQAVKGIQRQHMSDRGFGDIGYHFVIDPVGRVFAARSLAWQGAHARGSNNVSNIGVCLLGNFEAERPTSPALQSLGSLLDQLRERHHIPRTEVFGHCDFTATICPGRHLMNWVHRYKGGLAAASLRR
jgi:hypothetical protein